MTSPFEFADRRPAATGVPTEGGEVAALIFESIESADDAADDRHTLQEAELSARVAALEQQLRTQTAALAPQLDDARRTVRAETKAEAEREFTERLSRGCC